MSETKHTPGAIRAATAITEMLGNLYSPEKVVDPIAEIIDRATAAPEMLEAGRGFLHWFYDHAAGAGHLPPQWCELRRAIAKAEGVTLEDRSEVQSR